MRSMKVRSSCRRSCRSITGTAHRIWLKQAVRLRNLRWPARSALFSKIAFFSAATGLLSLTRLEISVLFRLNSGVWSCVKSTGFMQMKAWHLVLGLAPNLLALDITTLDGKTFRDCEVSKVYPDSICVLYGGGGARIK